MWMSSSPAQAVLLQEYLEELAMLFHVWSAAHAGESGQGSNQQGEEAEGATAGADGSGCQ